MERINALLLAHPRKACGLSALIGLLLGLLA
jgi:ElaB/YqjD/DUF883 family membrane-anchored ribosome-binding protein